MKTTLLASMALLCFTFAAAAADVTGKWTAEIPGRGGNTQTTTFTFKASGTVANQRGENPIADGKVDGDNISFTQTLSFGGNDIKMMYKGAVKGDTIEFTREVEGRGPATFTAKKAQ
jgi:hypothetical protein